MLCVLPLSFDYGLYQLLTCVRVGATLVLEPGFAFPAASSRLLEERADHGAAGGADGVPGAARRSRASPSASFRICACSPTPAPASPRRPLGQRSRRRSRAPACT